MRWLRRSCPLPALVRRAVFERVSFDEGLERNAYREETAFFVAAARAGFRCLLTPNTACWQNGQYGGGARSGRLHYEYWVARNNWRFLRRHGGWLSERGYISGPVRSQASFMLGRVRTVVGGYLRARRQETMARPGPARPAAPSSTPRTERVAGGVERFTALLRGMLERLGWNVTLAGPTGEPPRWLYRFGGGFLWW